MLFRKKPVVVSAVQWRGAYERGEFVAFDPPAGVTWKRRWWCPLLKVPVVRTLEGDMRVTPPRFISPRRRHGGKDEWGCPYPDVIARARVVQGDWIVTGVNGERYPVKPDIFEKTYECAEPAHPPTTPKEKP